MKLEINLSEKKETKQSIVRVVEKRTIISPILTIQTKRILLVVILKQYQNLSN